jgi:hypothetical protein
MAWNPRHQEQVGQIIERLSEQHRWISSRGEVVLEQRS